MCVNIRPVSSLHGEQEIRVRKLGTFLTFTCFWAILTRDSYSKMVFDETHAAKWFLTALGGAQHRNIRKNRKNGWVGPGPCKSSKILGALGQGYEMKLIFGCTSTDCLMVRSMSSRPFFLSKHTEPYKLQIAATKPVLQPKSSEDSKFMVRRNGAHVCATF